MRHWWGTRIATGIGIFLVAALVFSLVVMLLWNALVPTLFNGPIITYIQAIGLLILSHILLRGGGPWHHRGGWRQGHWRHRFEAMSPEERERFRQEWQQRCGWGTEQPGEKTKETAK